MDQPPSAHVVDPELVEQQSLDEEELFASIWGEVERESAIEDVPLFGTPLRLRKSVPSSSPTLDVPTPLRRVSCSAKRTQSPPVVRASSPTAVVEQAAEIAPRAPEVPAVPAPADIAPPGPQELMALALINHGSLEDLRGLKGIGPKSAAAIVEYRSSCVEIERLDDLVTKVGLKRNMIRHILQALN